MKDFIQAKTRVAFEAALSEGKVSEEQIAIIEDTNEIWIRGKYRKFVTKTSELTNDAGFAKSIGIEEGESGVVIKEIESNKYYKFGECTSLTIALAAEEGDAYREYMFSFDSGSTPTTLSVPEAVIKDADFAVKANTHYEVVIRNNYMDARGWTKA